MVKKGFQPEQTAGHLGSRHTWPWPRETWELRTPTSPSVAFSTTRSSSLLTTMGSHQEHVWSRKQTDNMIPEALLLTPVLESCAALLLPFPGEQSRSTGQSCRPPGAGKLGQSSAAVTRWGIKAPSSGRGVIRRRVLYLRSILEVRKLEGTTGEGAAS